MTYLIDVINDHALDPVLLDASRNPASKLGPVDVFRVRIVGELSTLGGVKPFELSFDRLPGQFVSGGSQITRIRFEHETRGHAASDGRLLDLEHLGALFCTDIQGWNLL